jgi:uncharacterized protein
MNNCTNRPVSAETCVTEGAQKVAEIPVGYELRVTKGKGDGLFATKHFSVGDTVLVGVVERHLPHNSEHATQVGRYKWVLVREPRMNHSCDPNCGVRLNDSGAYDLVAIKNIAPDDEINIDYTLSNYTLEYFPAQCLCGTRLCRGTVTGWKDLSNEQKAAYQEFIAPYMLEIDQDNHRA